RTQVSRLRRMLGPASGIVTDDRGYRLTVARDRLDAARFEDLLGGVAPGAAGGARHPHVLPDPPSLWRGPPPRAGGHAPPRPPPADPGAARREEPHQAARERGADVLLTLGRHAEATAALDALLAEHPERERARGLLMEALYHQGRHAEAVETYQAWRRRLADE